MALTGIRSKGVAGDTDPDTPAGCPSRERSEKTGVRAIRMVSRVTMMSSWSFWRLVKFPTFALNLE
eukprot:285604-Pyramimonas_sp.AAC.1